MWDTHKPYCKLLRKKHDADKAESLAAITSGIERLTNEQMVQEAKEACIQLGIPLDAKVGDIKISGGYGAPKIRYKPQRRGERED